MTDNQEQRDFWNGAIGERWVREQADLDRFIAPFGDAVMERAQIATGERVLDVGCGCGTTSLAIAERVGEKGRVVGLDLSAPMLARARQAAEKMGASHAPTLFIEGDASVVALDGPPFDVLFSRFGVMFFAEPTRAFAHLRKALAPSGRLAFVCWRALVENPWAKVPLDAVAAALGPPEMSPPRAPGPFAFAEEKYVREILEGAGYRAVSIAPFDFDGVLGGSLSEATAAALKLGPAARAYTNANDADKPRAAQAIEDALAMHVRDGAVRLGMAAWVVTARAS